MDTFYIVVLYVMTALYGLCIGSFLNVVIYRVPLGMSVSKPASHCPKCNTPIKWYDNIPVLSYTLLGGKCRNCKVHIPFRYTAVEILNMLLWVASVLIFWDKNILFAVISAITLSILICVCFIDIENMIIPDRFQIMILGLSLILLTYNFVFKNYDTAISQIIGGLSGFLLFFLISVIGTKIKGTEVMGGGDIKLVGVMGLLLGWQKLLLALLIGSVIATIFVIFSKSIRNGDKQIPFGPYLSLGFAIAILFGEYIILYYISLFTY